MRLKEIKFTPLLIRRIMLEFSCIECGYEDRVTYFHKSHCGRGRNLEPEILQERLEKRARILILRDASSPRTLHCSCGKVAAGTLWVAHHNTHILVSVKPVCTNCSVLVEDETRPHGYLPNLVTNNMAIVEDALGIIGVV